MSEGGGIKRQGVDLLLGKFTLNPSYKHYGWEIRGVGEIGQDYFQPARAWGQCNNNGRV